MPPLPIGAAGLKVARAHTKLGWHWWPEFNSINSTPYDGRRPCVQRSTCQSGCNEGAKASTDLTHWPKAIALGARLVTGARVRRIETDAQGPRDRRDLDRPGRRRALRAGEGRRPRGATRSARPGCCCCSASAAHPDGLANSSGLVGKRLMMHPVRERRRAVRGAADELAGPVRRPHRVARVLRDRREAWLRPRRALGPGAHRRADQHGAPEPGRRAGLGPRPPHPREDATSATARTGASSPRTCPTRRTTSRSRRRSPTRRGSRPRRSTTGCPTTRGGCSTSTSSGRRSRWTPPAPTRSRSTGSCATRAGTCWAPPGWATTRRRRWSTAGTAPTTSPNLYVVDGSCFVTSSGVNPTSTIVAIALRAADHMVETRFEQQVPV